MNKVIIIVEGDEVEIEKLKYYLNNRNIKVKHKTNEIYKKSVVTSLLHNLGVPSNIKGYRYIVKAIKLIIIKREKNMTRVYKELADIYNTKVSNIESSIRYAIEISWHRGDIDLIERLFGYSINISKVKPTNTEYLATIVESIIINDFKAISFDK